MNDDILKGKWMQLRGEIRQTWGDLTDDDLDRIAGERDKLAGVLRERYGWSQEETNRRIDEWVRDVEVRYGY